MKKIMTGAFALAMASNAFATASFEFSSIWWYPRYDTNYGYNMSGQGQGVGINWDLDNDLFVGAYSEISDVYEPTNYDTHHFTINAINVGKGVVKNAAIGLRLGTFYNAYDDYTGMLTDVYGNVTMMSGSVDKVSGSLHATFGGRFAREYENAGDYDFSGYFVSLGIGVGI